MRCKCCQDMLRAGQGIKDIPSLGAIVCSVFEYTHAAQTGSQRSVCLCAVWLQLPIYAVTLTTDDLTLTCDVRRQNRAFAAGGSLIEQR